MGWKNDAKKKKKYDAKLSIYLMLFNYLFVCL